MAKVLPFNGLRYNTDIISNIADVTAPPYDIISSEKQQEIFNKNEYNIIRIDFGPDMEGDSEANNRYSRSGAYLKDWVNKQVLIREGKPAFYIYEQLFSLSNEKTVHSLKGVISRVELRDFADKVILPHEETISGAKTDRLNLMRSTAANISPIYSLYLDEDDTISDFIEKNSRSTPDISFVTDDNIRQNIWVIRDDATNARITDMFNDKTLFIADGHHRYETALNYRNERRAEDGSKPGTRDYDYIMMMLVSMSSSDLFVFPTHRLIRDIPRFDEILLVGSLTDTFSVSKIHFTEGDYASIITARLSNTVDEKLFALYTGKNYYYLLKFKDFAAIDSAISDKSDAYKHLDVTILHKLILENQFGIDAENMKNQKNLVYTRDAAKAVNDVKTGKYQCAFLINPTKVSEIRDVASAHEKMPQKSTYFWPKLVTGLVINKFDD